MGSCFIGDVLRRNTVPRVLRIEDASTDSGTGRWTVIKIPTLSFYEYCQLLQLDDMPLLPDHLKITDIPKMENAEVADLMARFEPLVKHLII